MSKITYPSVPADHPDFKWRNGADVQSTWRRFGWVPPSLGRPAPPPEKPQIVDSATPRYRRVK